MQITLRKSKALQTAIEEAIKGIDIHAAISLNEFQQPEAVIAERKAKFMENISRRNALIDALYGIRNVVGMANDANGISARLTDIAWTEKNIQFYNGLASATEMTDIAVIKGRLDKIRAAKDEGRSQYSGRAEEVITSIVDANDIKGFKQEVAKLKKVKQKLQDEVLSLNVEVKITLSPSAVATLTSEDLL